MLMLMGRKMEPSNPPTLKELKSIRKKLLQRIEEARSIFSANESELRTAVAALQSLEELIESLRQTEAA